MLRAALFYSLAVSLLLAAAIGGVRADCNNPAYVDQDGGEEPEEAVDLLEGAKPTTNIIMLNACGDGDTETLLKLLKEGHSPNGLYLGSLPIIQAATFGRDLIIAMLIMKGADVNLRDEKGQTAVLVASYMGHIETVKLLLNRGAAATINAQNQGGGTALMAASERNHTDIINLLIDSGARVDEALDGDGGTALMRAAHVGNAVAVETLLKRGASVDAANSHSQTALMFAAHEDQVDAFRVLLRYGASRTTTSIEGLTARGYAMAGEEDEWSKRVLAVLDEMDAQEELEQKKEKEAATGDEL